MSVTTIATAGNTTVPACLAIRQLGYDLKFPSGDTCLCEAEGPLGRFIAEDPVTLLGLIKLRETRGEDWMASDAEIEAHSKLFADIESIRRGLDDSRAGRTRPIEEVEAELRQNFFESGGAV
ncbi:hypothetical protein [Stratiformator vulcanicus]|uniref:Uncharacterized protein n=1 Tax=Stratiformator vulcanicus TaxID=2527980 RepID=A0A517QXM0_9PLAN|nr:hypothetical protein [Stratiformator vulcanicus]QDT36320.1 hypothetical protein Pan189_06760 [Stratiformator vulcanicus]